MTKRFFTAVGVTVLVLAVAAATVAAENLAVAVGFRNLPRLTTDFSAAYFRRELGVLGRRAHPTIFLGDSVLWGYRLRADQSAVALLTHSGCDCYNLSFKSGSPANSYAVLRLLSGQHAHVGTIVLEVNQKAFNVADPSYQTLHPAIAALAAPLLSAEDRSLLELPQPDRGWLDRTLSEHWLLYAMRTDIRETLFGEPDAAPEPQPTEAEFEGSYNLHRLDEKNVAVHFLKKTADLMRVEGIRGIAFMTPTNHQLLHRYIDNEPYRKNGAYLRRLLEQRGIRVLDLDTAFSDRDFFDNDHLKAGAQKRLAALLNAALVPHTDQPRHSARG